MIQTAEKDVISDRYETRSGAVYLTGVQALVRLPMEQMRRDAAAGLRTRGFLTGYPGSPLGGYDIALRRAQTLLSRHGIEHVPAQNEELGATALIGTQMLDKHPSPDIDGVVGYWYGKGPGVDRASDAFKHGNFAGTSTHGAVVILSGEDHEAKSSSVPYQQEFAFEHYGVPVLYPSNVTEFLQYGLHAAALSRYGGCWVALKLVAPLCDGGELIDLDAVCPKIELPALQIGGAPFKKEANFAFFPVRNVATEHKLYAERHQAVLAYARSNRLDATAVSGANDRIGIVAAGKNYADTRQALSDLGFDDAALTAAGIRVAKIGMLAPFDASFMAGFGRGLTHLIVVEDKRDFLERQVGRAVCGLGPVQVAGKFDFDGAPLFPVAGGLDADSVAEGLARVLRSMVRLPWQSQLRLNQIEAARQLSLPAVPRRTPNYCSGCPHNVSTKLAPGQKAWGAPGCHVFAAVMEQPHRQIEAVTQLGGEGMPWIGLSPFTGRRHIVQNIGDGSLLHSSYLNIRFAVSAGVDMTFRILFNGVIANTGGQSSVNATEVPTLLNKLTLDGVKRIILIADDPKRYRGIKLPGTVTVRKRDALEDSMAELAATSGVTVLLYDGECANERRRRQKRGKLPPPEQFTVVNEDVCENCGDCGSKANCMSLQKVATEFGPKTQIHQSSCNQDRACLDGECPSFVTVRVKAGTGVCRPPAPELNSVLPEPSVARLSGPFHISLPGVGGTGVITLNAILAQAATLDGNQVKSYDQTGAAQKWGPVLSTLIIAEPSAARPIGNKIGIARTDLYLATDAMAAADRQNLLSCDPNRTASVINTDVLPSGEMIRNVNSTVSIDELVAAISTRTDGSRRVAVAARTIAERLFGDYMLANMITVGAAYQAGLLPISAASIERAIELNGTQVGTNKLAFRAGRMSQCDPAKMRDLLATPNQILADRLETVLAKAGMQSRVRSLMKRLPSLDREVERLVERRVADLIDYQGASYAERYVNLIGKFARVQEAHLPGEGVVLTKLVVRNLHKLMAYKDEYETARLLTDPVFLKRVRTLFPGLRSLNVNLQPPLLRSFGLEKKVSISFRLAAPALRLLKICRFLRGTVFDVFGGMQVRRAERAAIVWYCGLLDAVQERMSPAVITLSTELLGLPDQIRGYEGIKLAALQQAQTRAGDLLRRLQGIGVSS